MGNPLEQFQIKNLWDFNFAGFFLHFTNSSLFMVITVSFILLLFIMGTRRNLLIPNRKQMFVESIYDFVRNIVYDNISKDRKKYVGFAFSIFTFILFGNIIGMFPYAFTFTSHIIVTFTIAIVVLCFVLFVGFKYHGLKFFLSFVPPGTPKLLTIIMVPIEVISFLSRPVSLSVRLFANMMAGHTILKMFAGFVVSLGIFGVFPVLVNVPLIALEFLVAFLQAYVFTILTCLYIDYAIRLH